MLLYYCLAVSAAIDVSFSTEAYQFTGVSANRLRRNSTVLQQSSSQKLELRPAGSTWIPRWREPSVPFSHQFIEMFLVVNVAQVWPHIDFVTLHWVAIDICFPYSNCVSERVDRSLTAVHCRDRRDEFCCLNSCQKPRKTSIPVDDQGN